MAGDASRKFLGDASGPLLAEMRRDMRNELATRVARGKKASETLGARHCSASNELLRSKRTC